MVPEDDATQDAGPIPVHTDPDVGQVTGTDESVQSFTMYVYQNMVIKHIDGLIIIYNWAACT